MNRTCCAPRTRSSIDIRDVVSVSPSCDLIPHDEVPLAGGDFMMGDAFGEGYPTDGEQSPHPVRVDPFLMDVTAVTVAQFAAFVAATGYRTEAEIEGSSAVFHLAVQAKRKHVLGSFGMPWWVGVQGADWRHPFGPLSDTGGLEDHPVVHVTHNDALVYCRWAGRALPTEAEWEYAARGGLAESRYAWGDELTPDGQHRANIWQGVFPSFNSAEDGWLATAPVRSFAPNGFGLYQMAGNVWEWCADWFDAGYYTRAPRLNPLGPDDGTERVMRGGSYLCHTSYCNRYRVAARTGNTPNSSSGNVGFRTVRHLD